MHQIEIYYVGRKNVELNIHKLNTIKQEREHQQKYLV